MQKNLNILNDVKYPPVSSEISNLDEKYLFKFNLDKSYIWGNLVLDRRSNTSWLTTLLIGKK